MIKVIICEKNIGHDKESESVSISSSSTDKGFEEYIEVNGYHFSNELSEYASRLMHNADKSNHHWSVDEVKAAFNAYGYAKSADATWGDIAYVANMAYADFFGMPLKTEQEVLLYALADSVDVDGYEGKQLCRWLADCKKSGCEIDWKEFI